MWTTQGNQRQLPQASLSQPAQGDLHTLRRWRNAAEHGVENEDGTLSSWVDRPQGGGPSFAPALPARETIKQLIASIDGGWLAERRVLLLQEQQVQGSR